MPNKVERLPDGKLEIELETGEKFSGDPLEVTQKMADAHVSTKRWGQDFKQKYETIQNQPATPPPAPEPNPQDAQLQTYLVDQWAKGLGFKDGQEAKAKLGNVLQTTDEVRNQVIASNFLAACPDFPNTPEAIDRLSKKIDSAGWDFSPQSMIAAHTLCVKEQAYKPLSAEEQNAQWTQGLNAQNRSSAPPPPPPAGNTINSQSGADNPWEMPLDKLRKAALDGQLAGGK